MALDGQELRGQLQEAQQRLQHEEQADPLRQVTIGCIFMLILLIFIDFLLSKFDFLFCLIHFFFPFFDELILTQRVYGSIIFV